MSLNDWISEINWETFDYNFPLDDLSRLPESSSIMPNNQSQMEPQPLQTEMIPEVQDDQSQVEAQFQASIPIFQDEASFEDHVKDSWDFISKLDDVGTSSREMEKPMIERRPSRQAKIMDFVINGIPIPGIPIPGCSCTGTFRSCTRYDLSGWQSTCCTARFSQFPLPMGRYRKGTRIGGRKMARNVFEKVLHHLICQGYNFTEAIDLKCFWGKHGANRSLEFNFEDTP